jgi:xanthine dehydrogenase accessory factor
MEVLSCTVPESGKVPASCVWCGRDGRRTLTRVYDVALSVSACARSGTRADVAWMVSPAPSNDAVAFTPGGGRVGELAGGAFDGLLGDVAARKLPRGRRIRHEVTPIESPVCGLAVGTPVEFLIAPAEQFPPEIWQALLGSRPLAVTADIVDDEIVSLAVGGPDDAEGRAAEMLRGGQPAAEAKDADVVTVFAPIPRLVIAGAGPFAEALAAQGRLLGWRVAAETRPEMVAGLSVTLSDLDAIVVMGHDVESSSRCLMAALEGGAGYVGALGSASMQEARADWLAYRDVTDLSRVHGPAGLPLGARSPAEVAVSIVAEILDERAD